MNYLFFLGEYNGYINANKRIAFTIAEQFKKNNNSCYFACVNYEIENVYSFIFNNFHIVVLPANINNSKIRKLYKEIRAKCSIIELVTHPFILFRYLMSKLNERKDLLFEIKNIIIKNNIDYFISFYSPFNATFSLLTNKLVCKKIAYQLDPWGLHQGYSNIFNQLKELILFSKSDFVFTTKELETEYKKNIFYRPFLNKIYGVNFPNIKKYTLSTKSKLMFDYSKYNIVFLGSIDDSYRDPSAFLNFICKSQFFDLIKIYFIGKNTSKFCNSFKGAFSNNIELIEPISFDESNYIMNSNFFLLNINNTYTNQMPSKLIDYISTGNPIINIIKNKNDNSILLLNKYDLVFNFYEFTENDIHDFDMFLYENKNKRINYKKIEEVFIDYTPKKVAENILKVINKHA